MKDLEQNIKACVFDAYGTLFDVHSAVGVHKEKIGSSADAVSATWRGKQLEYTWLRSLMRQHTDFWQVTGDALSYALETHNVQIDGLHNDLMQAYLKLDAYVEVIPVLTALKNAGYKTAILSNGAPPMLESAVSNAGIASLIDACLSVEDVQIFKPDPKVYQQVTETFNLQPEQVLFQSSNAWDASGAAAFGFNVLWVNRFGQKVERLPSKPTYESKDLRMLLELLAIENHG